MTEEASGRVPSAPGSHPSGHAGCAVDGASRFDPSRMAGTEAAVTFLKDAARHFERLETGGEDRAHWANVYNAQNCRQIAVTLALYHNALCSIVSWHADAPDVFPDWETAAAALAEIAAQALGGQEWLSDRDRDRAADETRSGSVERSEIEPGPKASPNLSQHGQKEPG